MNRKSAQSRGPPRRRCRSPPWWRDRNPIRRSIRRSSSGSRSAVAQPASVAWQKSALLTRQVSEPQGRALRAEARLEGRGESPPCWRVPCLRGWDIRTVGASSESRSRLEGRGESPPYWRVPCCCGWEIQTARASAESRTRLGMAKVRRKPDIHLGGRDGGLRCAL